MESTKRKELKGKIKRRRDRLHSGSSGKIALVPPKASSAKRTQLSGRAPVAVLHDGEVRLEPFSESHLSGRYVSWLRDRHVVRYSEQRHRTHSLSSCRQYWKGMRDSGNPLWAIMLLADGVWRHVGNISATIDYANAVADVGILVGERSAQGRGVGKRAWALVCDHLLGTGGMRKVTAGTMSVNEPMLRIMRSTCMIEEGTRKGQFLLDGKSVDLVMFAKFRVFAC